MRPLTFACATRSELGLRENNEDAVFASPRIAAVADGVGGAAAGEVASRAMIGAIAELDAATLQEPLEVALAAAVRRGNEAVASIARQQPDKAGLATTLAAVALDEDGNLLIASIGDSRIYRLSEGTLTLLTRDDSLVQELLDQDAITEAEARNHPHRSVVTDAIDGAPRVEVRIDHVPARLGDRLLVCSDGLSDVLRETAIAELLSTRPREEAAAQLTGAALEAGGKDNVSVVVADVQEREDDGDAWRR
jgi:serine/threonine protein phosphatase PrpC